MVACLLLFFMAQTKTTEVSLPFIKADTTCLNKQNESDKTLFTYTCLKRMVANYKPVKVYYATYDSDNREKLIECGVASCVYLSKEQIVARIEIDSKMPENINKYVLNAKTYSVKGDFYINTSCILEISNAEIKSFVLRQKDKAITFE